MPAQVKITKRVVDSIECDGSDRFHRDRELPGFGLRVRASGKKYFVTQFRVAGRLRRMTLGPVTALAGCKMNLTADLYSTDLRAAKAGTPDLAAPAALAFQVPSVKKCDEYTAKISEIMAGIMDNFAPRGCSRADMESFLLADTQMPFFVSEDEWEQSDALFGVFLFDRPDPEHIGVRIVLNTDKYSILTNRMDEKFHQTVDLQDSKVTMVLNNDERTAVTFAVKAVFVNAVPVLGEKEFKLDRRQKVYIVLSNVATAFLAKEGTTAGFTLRKSVTNN